MPKGDKFPKKLPKKWQKGKFQYVVTTDIYYWPRLLANEINIVQLTGSTLFDHIVSIKDLQNDTHMYGNTYVIPHEKKR